MREIKFRAWDGISKKMWTPVWFDFAHIYYGFDYEKDCPIAVMPRWDTNPIMQFTGLLDKNGKEIYEGDILKLCNTDVLLEVFWDERESAFELRPKLGAYFTALFTTSYEVIGNIYEHPELLKEEK